jgi:oligoendopeptidase F
MVFVAPTPAGGDMVTLLHEMGHACGLNHDRTSTGTTGRNFMNEAEARSTMMKWQLQKLSTAFFVL